MVFLLSLFRIPLISFRSDNMGFVRDVTVKTSVKPTVKSIDRSVY